MGKIGTRKGLATISVLLIASSLLFMVSSVAQYRSSLVGVDSGLLEFEEASTQADSFSHNAKMLLYNEGMNVSLQGLNISFKENISALQAYPADFERLAQFFRANSIQANLTINTSEAKRPRAYISPQNIAVDNVPGKISFIPANAGPSAGNVSGYAVLITLAQPLPSFNWTELSNLTQPNPNGMGLRIGVQGTNGANSTSVFISKYAGSTLQLLNASGSPIIVIQAYSPAALDVNYNTNAIIETILQLNSTSSAELGRSIINVTSGKIGLNGGAVLQ